MLPTTSHRERETNWLPGFSREESQIPGRKQRSRRWRRDQMQFKRRRPGDCHLNSDGDDAEGVDVAEAAAAAVASTLF